MAENFNHKKAGVADKIALIGELEHSRRHALRSAVVAKSEEDKENSEYDSENFDSFSLLVFASQAKNMRRAIMQKHFGDIDSKYWCLCKSAAAIRQIAYELDLDVETLQEIDNFVDDIWGSATNQDLSDCVACKEDKETIQ